ncbi:triose-phosphate isomerase, partial [Anncaliia algerae PRA109]
MINCNLKIFNNFKVNLMKYCYGNWKLNTSLKLTCMFSETPELKNVELGIAPSYPFIPIFKETLPSQVKIGAQNCSDKLKGAFTGEVSASMLQELEIDFIILGHSERRHVFLENNEIISKKIQICEEMNIKIIYCIGETLDQRNSQKTNEVLKEQLSILNSLKNIIIAYETVWAINTGVAAKKEDVAEAVKFIKENVKHLGDAKVL